MVKKVRYILLFQRKLLLPTIVISLLLGFFGSSVSGGTFSTNAGLAYLFVLPLFQFFVYELRYANEYYFYYNMGISKIMLWGACIANVFIVNVIIALL